MANPQIIQGSLNRLRASVTWNDNPSLNVTASFLGKEGVSMAFEGDATTFINTMVGAVTSPEPYQLVTLTINLLKTQGLAQLYEQQRLTNSQIGDGVVRTDSVALGAYDIVNCAIQSVRELKFSGEDAGYAVTVRGYYPINSSLYDS